MRPAIISLGEVLWDLFPDGARFGGAPANFACHAAILGGEVAMASAVGDDERGHEALVIMGRYGIDTTLVQVVAGAPTGAVGIQLDDAGKPAFTIHEGSAWDEMAWTPELGERVRGADAVYFGTLGQRGERSRATIRRALAIAAEAGVRRVLDVNLRAPFYNADLIRESIEHASILKLSDDELGEVCAAAGVTPGAEPEQSLRRLLEGHHLDLVVMTRGADGALLVTSSETVDQPGIPAEVRDTVGAGDSFTAALVLGLLRGDAPSAIVLRACEVAAAVCAISGAVPEPSPTEVRTS